MNTHLLPAEHGANAARAATILHVAAVIIAVLSAILAVSLETAVGALTLGLAVLVVLPIVLSALPIVLPQPLRLPVALANAVVVTGFAVLTFPSVGAFFVPLALQLWVAVTVPWRVGRGLDLSQKVAGRFLGAATVALPALLLTTGMASGSLGLNAATVGIVAVLILVALGFAGGLRVMAPVIAGLGLALLIAAFFDAGLLLLGLWWVGGYYLTFGLGASVAWPPGRLRQPDVAVRS